MEDVNCIICGGNKFSHYLDVKCRYSRELFTLHKCSCSLILTSPRPSQKEMSNYYHKNYSPHLNANSKEYFLSKLFKKISYSWKFKLIKKYIDIKNINLLDIGGGDGSLAIYLKNRISRVDVYEKNKRCIDFMNKNNIFATSHFKQLKNQKYNIITLWHSLEHIHDIDNLFNHMNRVSTDNCLLIIATPNVLASEISFLTNKWIAWDVPRHLYHFSPKTLNLLLQKYNWKIIKIKNMKQDTLFNVYMSLDGFFIKKILFFIFICIYSFIVQIFLNKKFSSNLVVCQKK